MPDGLKARLSRLGYTFLAYAFVFAGISLGGYDLVTAARPELHALAWLALAGGPLAGIALWRQRGPNLGVGHQGRRWRERTHHARGSVGATTQLCRRIWLTAALASLAGIVMWDFGGAGTPPYGVWVTVIAGLALAAAAIDLAYLGFYRRGLPAHWARSLGFPEPS